MAPDGTVTPVPGTGAFALGGDGGPATAAQLDFPAGVAATADGGFLIADNDNHRIRRVSADGTITTVAGTGVRGSGGDDGPATVAQLNDPAGVATTADGGYLIADKDNHRIRRVSARRHDHHRRRHRAPPGSAVTAGRPRRRSSTARFGVAPTADGGFLIADDLNHRVRRVAPDGTITTVAGYRRSRASRATAPPPRPRSSTSRPGWP